MLINSADLVSSTAKIWFVFACIHESLQNRVADNSNYFCDEHDSRQIGSAAPKRQAAFPIMTTLRNFLSAKSLHLPNRRLRTVD
jgi:hypothetical protein